MSRGGAGNILAIQQEKARLSADVEAQLQRTIDSAPAQIIRTQEYAHSGRGGSGNYYSPKTLKETGHFGHQNPMADARGQQQTNGQPVPVAKYGRGGMGNMVYGVAESEQNKNEDDKLKREKIEVESEREAEQSIALPPKAKLPLPGYDPTESNQDI
ncbi:uncharacterized protein RCC_06251 [Ramularia collo-cygni]|uniref:Uncharacterized protein n=1 Tax=Ramularia collo-cygni TaxID=112498 RepID=A0A2D3UUV8_9PEZI|nr:uncharacterized protein RCC_06251 [Ramularia collo-cygni]CZT20391.1 uncharacterized protein RCC_06251 [Ramularia collo-cygni]